MTARGPYSGQAQSGGAALASAYAGRAGCGNEISPKGRRNFTRSILHWGGESSIIKLWNQPVTKGGFARVSPNAKGHPAAPGVFLFLSLSAAGSRMLPGGCALCALCPVTCGCFFVGRAAACDAVLPEARKECSATIPCKTGCDHYCEGCHKTCPAWKELQQRFSLERQKKKNYLNYYNDLCSTVVRQCRANEVRTANF